MTDPIRRAAAAATDAAPLVQPYAPFDPLDMAPGHPLAGPVAFAQEVAALAAGLQVLAKVEEREAMNEDERADGEPTPRIFSTGDAGALRGMAAAVLGLLAADAERHARRWHQSAAAQPDRKGPAH